MSIVFVNHKGEVFGDEARLPLVIGDVGKKPTVVKEAPKRVFRRDEANESLGFLVVGYSPEQLRSLSEDYERAKDAHSQAPDKFKSPGAFDEFANKWRNKNKPKRARSKPYSVMSAAQQCAEMMTRAGWQNVVVEELMRKA